jgi:histidyl-tRNA synthetase
LEALGLSKGYYIIKLNSRKLLETALKTAEVDDAKRGTVLRAIDKFDRLGEKGVRLLLGEGRKDESGDFTKGAGLNADQTDLVMELLLNKTDRYVGSAGVQDLWAIKTILEQCGYENDRVEIDTGIVRGLDYYTGAVFEAQLTFPVQNEAGETVVFGSVAGGGRYDDLVARFTGQTVPATGVSIGVSRLISALSSRGLSGEVAPLVLVTVMDKAETARSFQMVAELRKAGIRAEAYVGTGKFGDQMKYADKRGAAIAVIEGGDERAKGEVTLKDLALGAELAKSVESRAQWVDASAQAQLSVRREHLVAAVNDILRQR